jgi:hypothetical protein
MMRRAKFGWVPASVTDDLGDSPPGAAPVVAQPTQTLVGRLNIVAPPHHVAGRWQSLNAAEPDLRDDHPCGMQ